MGIISLMLFFLGFVSFFTKSKYLTLITIAILSTRYFGFYTENFYIGSFSLQHGDVALVLIFSLIPFRTKNIDLDLNKLRKAIILFLSFLFISISYDLIYRDISIIQVFRTTRKIGYFAFFFLISSFKYIDYIKFFKFIIYFTIFHSILYLSQYVFSYSLFGEESKINELGGVRYGLSPVYIIPSLCALIFIYSKTIFRVSTIYLLIITILFTQSRGAIIAMVSVYLTYLVYQNKLKIKYLFIFPFLASIIYFSLILILPVIVERFDILFYEIASLTNLNLDDFSNFYTDGTLTFRFVLTAERFLYVIQDPIFSLLGVGFFPDNEISSALFFVNSFSPDLPIGHETYNSVDIFFPNIITRYGLLGSVVYIVLIYQFFKFSIKNKKYIWSQALHSFLISLLFISLINESFYNGQYFFMIFVLVGLTIKSKIYIPIKK